MLPWLATSNATLLEISVYRPTPLQVFTGYDFFAARQFPRRRLKKPRRGKRRDFWPTMKYNG